MFFSPPTHIQTFAFTTFWGFFFDTFPEIYEGLLSMRLFINVYKFDLIQMIELSKMISTNSVYFH